MLPLGVLNDPMKAKPDATAVNLKELQQKEIANG